MECSIAQFIVECNGYALVLLDGKLYRIDVENGIAYPVADAGSKNG